MTTKTPEQRQATDRQNAVTDAADPIAEYWRRYGDLDWHKMMDEITYAARDRRCEMDMEAAKDLQAQGCIEHAWTRWCTACGKPCFYESLCGSCGDLGNAPRQCLNCGEEES